jgi:hypothetical protein
MLNVFRTTVRILPALGAAGALFFAVCANGQSGYDPAKVKKGMEIAPVPLNMEGKNPDTVGFGSYLVNAVSECNGCHSAGPATEYAKGGNPYMGQPRAVNTATYLGGGRDFGPFPSPVGNFPHIVSRNLTPDYTGMAAGGMTWDKFVMAIRHGADMDHLHPPCAGAPDGKCIPPPFDGNLLMIMPWPAFADMADDDLQAMYAYLSSIPCLEGGPGEPPNRCTAPAKTSAVAGPKNATVVSRNISLDGTQSTSGDMKPLTYAWTMSKGSPIASIVHGSSAMPMVQFGQGRGMYTFLLTVTDTGGTSATDAVTVNYAGN